MSRDWEAVFKRWSQGPSETEKKRGENAERQIREAISISDKLRNRNIKVFQQGSYRNRVNIRKDSDVDIGIVCFDTFFPEYPDDNVKAFIEKRGNIKTSSYVYATFKNEIEEALVNRFGRSNVERGSKSFDIKENSYRVEADVAAFFEHRRYDKHGEYISGVEMKPDNCSPSRVKNWPEQHYENGVRKNTETDRLYKRMVRILKSLSNEMQLEGIVSAQKMPSFLLECLVWNAPNEYFSSSGYKPLVRSILAYLFNNTRSDKECSEWGEVSELKYLFRSSQPWTRQEVHDFIYDAWNYIGYE
ncbi:nucleotidyltransferase domain-containing protein [Cysteiniphilum sp. 6C5]|uniref:nucleotidyltransferase domain-containing protein n=1 Tax=unclassified Cysteiniphilum TaxID=2610889 RepID=UPI003F8431A5